MVCNYYSAASLQPNSSIGFLVKRCGVLLSQVAERRFDALPVSFTSWQVLMALTQQPHLSATKLSEQLGHDMGALTRVVDELERQGFVRRERSSTDRRAVEIAITAAGRRQAQAGKRLIVELLNLLLEPYSKQETDMLIALLQRMLQHLQRVAGAAAPVAPPERSVASRPRRSSQRERAA